MVADTCRYSSGPLIPSSATATVCLLNICRCRLPSLFLYFLFIWSLLNVKLQIFPILVCLLFWKHNNFGWLICVCRFKRKNGWRTPQGLFIGAPTSQYTSYSAMFCLLHSNISKEQHEKNLCNPSSHYEKYGEYARETRAPCLDGWKP